MRFCCLGMHVGGSKRKQKVKRVKKMNVLSFTEKDRTSNLFGLILSLISFSLALFLICNLKSAVCPNISAVTEMSSDCTLFNIYWHGLLC